MTASYFMSQFSRLGSSRAHSSYSDNARAVTAAGEGGKIGITLGSHGGGHARCPLLGHIIFKNYRLYIDHILF